MKRTFIIIIILAAVFGGIYAYKIYTGKVKSLTELETEASLQAPELIAAFEKDSATAHKQYLGKILEVTGKVKSVEQEQQSTTVILGEEGALSSVRCSMDSAAVKLAQALNPGSAVTIKGACTGFMADDMGLGSDVILNRCVLSTKK